MAATAMESPRFVRRTGLGQGEYRKNFRQVDCDVISAVTSREADRVTPLMSKIYLRLANAPAQYREREGVLRFEAELRGEARVGAWEALCELLGVASATASKALRWMHEQGVIGYFARKNGVGIRVFLNRATSSIGSRTAGKKILEFSHTSPTEPRASLGEAAFSDSFADSEVLDSGLNPRAPKNGAVTKTVGKALSTPAGPPTLAARTPGDREGRERSVVSSDAGTIPLEEIVGLLTSELAPRVREVAACAAAQSAAREMERTREWFETKALPKAVRVAQRETCDLLRKHGALEGRGGRVSAGPEVGRAAGDYTAAAARPLTAEEIRETAEVCVALFEAQEKSIEATLSEIGSEGGGWLLPEDVPRVRQLAEALASGGGASGT